MATKKKMTKATTAAPVEAVVEEKIEAVETPVVEAVEAPVEGVEAPVEERGDIMDEAPVAEVNDTPAEEAANLMDGDFIEDMDEAPEYEDEAVEVEAPAETVFSDVPMPEASEAPIIEDSVAREERRKAMVERIRARMKGQIERLNEARERVEASDIKDTPATPEIMDEEKAAREERRRLYAMAWAAMQNN